MIIDLGKNLDEVEISDGFEPTPPGTYTLLVSKMPEVKQGNKAPYIYWELEIIRCENTELNKNKIFHNTSLSEKALGMPTGIKAFLQSIGLGWDDSGFDGTQAVGLELKADVVNHSVTETDNMGNPVLDADGNPKVNIYDDIEALYEVY